MCTRIRKGIINPNYPGFQSLAYTLNDDHFDYSSENPSDDEEDSYVSESDDNELKRREPAVSCVGDENGNSFLGRAGGAEEEEEQEEEEEEKEKQQEGSRRNTDGGGQETLAYHSSEKSLSAVAAAYENSPTQWTRMRPVIPTDGCRSPSYTMMDTGDRQDAIGIYACTPPPDIVLQHSTAFGSPKEQQKVVSLELTACPRPDLIPEHQLQLQERKKNELNKLKQLEREADGDEDEDDHEDHDNYDNYEDEKERDAGEGEEDAEGNRTPPSPAVELANERTISISISNSDSSRDFLRNVTLSPDPMLDDVTRCYGSASDGTLSDDSDPDQSDQDDSDGGAEFGYQPYDGEEETVDSRILRPIPEVAGTPESEPGESAGSSPGEVQYHLVDDCSNQTVQITRSRQPDQSPTKQYHALLQQYSVLGPADFCNNQPVLAEGEVNCNIRYPALRDSAQTITTTTSTSLLSEFAEAPYGARRMYQEEPHSTDYPDVRPHSLSMHRHGHSTQHTPTVLSEEHKVRAETKVPSSATTTTVAVRQHQKVPKVNPFSELLLQENDTCDFFTKQAKLQIEARMALCQAKDMAHMQMEIEKRSLPLSPVTKVIHTAVEKAGLCLAADKRRLSRYYLTRLGVPQLRTILLELQCHAEVLNEELVELLMERDELHISQDATLIDIEDLSRYLCAKEQTITHAERQHQSYPWSSNKTLHPPAHQRAPQSHPQPQQLRTPCGVQQPTVPAYRYH